MKFIGRIVSTGSPAWFSTSTKLVTRPRSGRERERRASVMVAWARSVSPGRTGSNQRSSSMPGEARPCCGRKFSTISAHQRGDGMPAAGDHAAERPLGRPVAIDMHRLRVVSRGESDDVVLGQREACRGRTPPRRGSLRNAVRRREEGWCAHRENLSRFAGEVKPGRPRLGQRAPKPRGTATGAGRRRSSVPSGVRSRARTSSSPRRWAT